jgi:hypothetical protein
MYSIDHAAHRLSSVVGMFKGEVFPRCAGCSEAVTFHAIREFPGLDVSGGPFLRIPLHELTVLEGDASPAAWDRLAHGHYASTKR